MELFCVKCDKKTTHHFFMMSPWGVMVCNVCGSIHKGDWEKAVNALKAEEKHE